MKHNRTPVRPTADKVVSIGFENLVGDKWLAVNDSSAYKVTANLEELIDTLAHTRPKWFFVGCNSHGSLGYINFNVFEGDEYLGSVGVDSGRSDFRYVINNARMDRKKTRTHLTHSLTTRDIKKAKKEINKNFGPKSAEEQLAELDTTARAGLGSLSASRYSDYRLAFNTLVQLITPAIEKQPELFAAMCPEIDSKVLEDCAEHKHKTDTTKSVNEALRNALGVFIITRGGEYLVKDLAATDGASNTLTSEAIPFEIKRKLGMLKLLPVGATLQDVGYKIADDKFFLVGDWSESQGLA